MRSSLSCAALNSTSMIRSWREHCPESKPGRLRWIFAAPSTRWTSTATLPIKLSPPQASSTGYLSSHETDGCADPNAYPLPCNLSRLIYAELRAKARSQRRPELRIQNRLDEGFIAHNSKALTSSDRNLPFRLCLPPQQFLTGYLRLSMVREP